MRRIPILFFFILAFIQISLGQWVEKNISTSSTLNAVHFIDNENGYVSAGSKIYKTNDGGTNWVISFEPTGTIYFNDIFVLDENVAFAVGINFDSNKSLIAKTKNNGTDWELIDVSDFSSLNSVYFISNSTGFCSGNGGTILKSTDSGETWQSIESGTNVLLQDIYFVNDTKGIVVGGSITSSTILKTNDGGNEWNSIDTPNDSSYLQSVYFVNEQTGYAVGWWGEIIKTEDCGSTWTSQGSANMFGNLDVVFTNESTGYVVGGQSNVTSIQKTVNGGELWEDISPNIPFGLISIHFPSFDIGYTVGAGGTVLKTESGGVTTSTSFLFSEDEVLLYPNPTVNSVSIESKNDDQISRIELYNGNGQILEAKETNSSKTNLDLSGFKSGIYYLSIHTERGHAVRKLVKK